jgi:FkbM family methyltransferase
MVNRRIAIVLRTAQTFFPGAVDLKYQLQRTLRRTLRRSFEKDFLGVPLLGLPESPLMLDIGANRGQSIDALRLVVPDCRIVAFEPNPVLAERLRRSYQRKSSVDIRAVGLGSDESESLLYLPIYRGFSFDGLASFIESEAREWLRTRLLWYNDTNLTIAVHTCRIKCLDDLNLAPDFIKIDIQGFEFHALRGGHLTLERHRPALLIETPSDEVIQYLSDFGYQQYVYQDGRLVAGHQYGRNSFFVKACLDG